jgi:hypothetical protein
MIPIEYLVLFLFGALTGVISGAVLASLDNGALREFISGRNEIKRLEVEAKIREQETRERWLLK